MKNVFLFIVLALSATLAFSHSPTDIKLEYNPATKVLTINVMHPLSNTPVSDPIKHFIKDITVSVNGKVVILETIAFQQSATGETSSFLLNVKSGDRISVRGTCNISGVKVSEISVK